ncbi:GIY-YIG nuclease family protein [Mycoplasma sp. CSL10137]|uniref:GIY-YIG nuclease family protein n=2 Tax=Mycoplasma TaxID=2093 RepID=UPI00197BC12F|nr:MULTISPECIES: GIY-YIG nuclease family protein [unclassified Mycoplasma]MBN4083377.1 GIY-YIG nuclease family protein [Mycoplasma sp. CSL10137]MBN4084321.1 GIY-YIG nuclease family protein [Mycoplasma sp. CSL10166]
MNNSKNFNLYLMDGDVTGRIKCTLANWTGLVYKVPRSHIDKCKDRQDLKQSGVYFLFDKNDNDEDEVYIGQAGIRKNGEGILFRVMEHLRDNTYFSDVVMITTQNNSFGPTEISYLENRFTNMTVSTDRFKVRNENDPNPGNVTEEKESELEDFIEYSKMVLGVLGYKLFVPLIDHTSKNTPKETKELMLYLSRKNKKSNKIIESKCMRTNEGFVVLKDSIIELEDSNSIPKTIKEIRKKCKNNNEIVNGRLTKNYLFNSPSYAAAFVLGMNTNGRTDWKNENGITLKDIEENGDNTI